MNSHPCCCMKQLNNLFIVYGSIVFHCMSIPPFNVWIHSTVDAPWVYLFFWGGAYCKHCWYEYNHPCLYCIQSFLMLLGRELRHIFNFNRPCVFFLKSFYQLKPVPSVQSQCSAALPPTGIAILFNFSLYSEYFHFSKGYYGCCVTEKSKAGIQDRFWRWKEQDLLIDWIQRIKKREMSSMNFMLLALRLG